VVGQEETFEHSSALAGK